MHEYIKIETYKYIHIAFLITHVLILYCNIYIYIYIYIYICIKEIVCNSLVN